jgi:hypothetical protein
MQDSFQYLDYRLSSEPANSGANSGARGSSASGSAGGSASASGNGSSAGGDGNGSASGNGSGAGGDENGGASGNGDADGAAGANADDIVATSINVESSGQFAKDVALYGSRDGTHWEFAGSGSIFQVEGSRKLSMPLRPEGKHTWYRFRISGNQEPVSFSRVWLEHSLDIVSRNSFAETFAPAMSARQDGKSTVIALDGLKNLALSEIVIETDSMFKRNVHANGSAHALYNLVFGEERYRDLTMPMGGFQCPSDRLELRIDDGDDAPISVDSVLVSYLAYDVVFQNTGLPVTLYFGNGEILAPPRYDISGYKEHILAEGYGRASIGEIAERPAKLSEESGAPDYTALFNATIIVAAVLLAAVLATRLKNVKKGNC